MKKLLAFLLLFFVQDLITGQTVNSNGLYVNDKGKLFSGIVKSTENGVQAEYSVINGVLEGNAKFYYAGGKLMESGMYAAGLKNDKWIRYTEAGSVSAIAFYKQGKKSGTWVVYGDNGNKRCELNYTDGQKSGIWTSWNEEGQITESKDYSKLN